MSIAKIPSGPRDRWNKKQQEQRRSPHYRAARDPAVRRRAVEMFKDGALTIREIRDTLHVSERILQQWKAEEDAKPQTRVITPAPYAVNYRWFNTKW